MPTRMSGGGLGGRLGVDPHDGGDARQRLEGPHVDEPADDAAAIEARLQSRLAQRQEVFARVLHLHRDPPIRIRPVVRARATRVGQVAAPRDQLVDEPGVDLLDPSLGR